VQVALLASTVWPPDLDLPGPPRADFNGGHGELVRMPLLSDEEEGDVGRPKGHDLWVAQLFREAIREEGDEPIAGDAREMLVDQQGMAPLKGVPELRPVHVLRGAPSPARGAVDFDPDVWVEEPEVARWEHGIRPSKVGPSSGGVIIKEVGKIGRTRNQAPVSRERDTARQIGREAIVECVVQLGVESPPLRGL
jgi:hypothetical protein